MRHKILLIILINLFLITKNYAMTITNDAYDMAYMKLRKEYLSTYDSIGYIFLECINKNIRYHKSMHLNIIENNDTINEEYLGYDKFKKILHQKSINNDISIDKKYIPDTKIISYNFLKNHIANTKLLYGNKWNRNLSLEDFCNYVLPYKVQYEPIDSWDTTYRNHFDFLNNSKTNELINNLQDYLSNFFYSSFKYEDGPLSQFLASPLNLLKRREGSCQDMCNITIYALRSIGVAATVDFTPAWGTSSFRHWWCVVKDSASNFIPFEGVHGTPADFEMKREPGKVFRITYTINKNSLPFFIPDSCIPVPHLKMNNLIDVTAEYWNVQNLAITTQDVDSTLFYISVFNNHRWYPIDFSFSKNHIINFKDLSIGVIYLPYKRIGNKTTYPYYPYLIDKKGIHHYLQINYLEKKNFIITEDPQYLIFRPNKKYRLYYWYRDRKSTRLNSSHRSLSRMPSSAWKKKKS